MPQAPILIFDKSALEALNPDEAELLDYLFQSNITPLFFIETLADLEKQLVSGRTPEQLVGNLAYKTPDLNSILNVHHVRLLEAELFGLEKIRMDGRPIIPAGKPMALQNKKGLMLQRSLEEEAFHRWQRHEFLDLERQIAKKWRQSLADVNYQGAYEFFRKWFPGRKKPSSPLEVKSLVDAFIDRTDQETALSFGMTLLGTPPTMCEQAKVRWENAGRPPMREFAPYFRHVFSVDFFFYIGIASDLISRERPTNKVDLAYLYYLPFCMVFTSSDYLHARTVPLFLRSDQTFIRGQDLKSDLQKLDQHYSALPEYIKDRGATNFASHPPIDSSFLVTQLWDKHLPNWKTQQTKSQVPLDENLQRVLRQLVDRIEKEAQPIDPATTMTLEDTDYVHMERKVMTRKGKWKRFPPDVERNSK